VDAHRSIAIVASKYAPHPKEGEAAVVDSRFYSTVSMLRTMETLLQVPPMNNNDAFCSLLSTLFTGPGDQPAFAADVSNRDNGLIYTANTPSAPGAAQSEKMDFRHADRADPNQLNVILWRDAMAQSRRRPCSPPSAARQRMSTTEPAPRSRASTELPPKRCITAASGAGRGPSSCAATRDKIHFGSREHAGINIAAQGCGLRSRPIRAQQPRRQQRIAQMQPAILMDQERAHDETCLMVEGARRF